MPTFVVLFVNVSSPKINAATKSWMKEKHVMMEILLRVTGVMIYVNSNLIVEIRISIREKNVTLLQQIMQHLTVLA